MWYQTELMREILKSATAQRIVDYVSPIYGNSYYGLWLFEVIGKELDDIKSFVNDLNNQLFIETATWSIPYWEKTYGITPNENLTDDQRRQQVLLKRQKRPMNPKRLKSILEAMTGEKVSIVELSSKNTITVTIMGNIDNLDEVKAFIERVKPAHIFADVRISEVLEQNVTIEYKIYEVIQESETIIFEEVV